MQIFPNINYGYSAYDPAKEVPNLQGKVVLVTGANSGIGYTTAEVLVSKGAKASEGILDCVGRRLDDQQDYVDEVSEIHCSFVLTEELMPVLKRTAEEPNSDVRIVVVSSKTHLWVSEKPDFRNLEGWNARNGDGVADSGLRYAVTKLANVLFTRELQSRLDAENIPITCISLHPGIVSTEGPRNAIKSGIFAYLIKLILATFGLTPLQGSYTTLFAATSEKIKAEPTKYKGSYLQPFNRLADISAYAKDGQLAKDLWACSEEVAEICLKGYRSHN
ncbi:hypothetical protein FRC05_004963 [Tulasnella sp. 425]|nr:hypothetical protein FRC05_004963 [Tulasnella sp. 425]